MKVVIMARNFVFDGCDAVALLENAGYAVTDISGQALTGEALANALSDADAVINGFEPMDAELLSQCPHLKLISVRGVGWDYLDSAVCRERGIAITRAVGTVGNAVSEQVMAYLLFFARQVHRLNAAMQAGEWNRIMTEGAAGKTIGIIGFGEIGQAVAHKAEAFGMKVVYYCRTQKEQLPYSFVPLEDLLAESDYVVLALPLTEETRGLIDAEALAKMKRTAVLINVARAGIVDTDALRTAVKSGALRGAAVDVFEHEPCTDSVLKGLPQVLLTPHTAPFTKANFIAMNRLAAQNVIDYFSGVLDKKYLAQ